MQTSMNKFPMTAAGHSVLDQRDEPEPICYSSGSLITAGSSSSLSSSSSSSSFSSSSSLGSFGGRPVMTVTRHESINRAETVKGMREIMSTSLVLPNGCNAQGTELRAAQFAQKSSKRVRVPSSSAIIPARSLVILDRPVRLPPGRARLVTNLLPTGSGTCVKTTGDD